LIGAECSGKSALALALADALPAVVATEVLREFVEQEGRTPRAGEQRSIMLLQQEREDALADAHPDAVVIGDPAALMTAIYGVAYFDDESLMADAARLARQYSLLVWCDIDVPWQSDGIQRDGEAMRTRVHQLIGDVLTDSWADAPLVRASGSLHDRITVVRRAWQQQVPSVPT
jgi:nicotinamide riboside kinase